MHRSDKFGLEPLPQRRVHHPVADELRQRRLVEVLQLAPAASPEVAARRLGTVRAGFERPVRPHDIARRRQRHMPPRCRDAIAFRGDADDFLALAHNAVA